jgi:hypothetical protein
LNTRYPNVEYALLASFDIDDRWLVSSWNMQTCFLNIFTERFKNWRRAGGGGQ